MENINNSKTESGALVPQNCPVPGHLEELLCSLEFGNGVGGNHNGVGLTAEQEVANQYKSQDGKWEPKKLNARHREIMRRIIEGATYTDIATQMGIHTQTVMLVATSKLFREELSKMEEGLDLQVIQRAEEMSNEALDVIKTLMRNARSEALRKSCADRILDTAGYSKVEKKLIGVVNGEDVIKELNRRRRESLEAVNGGQA